MDVKSHDYMESQKAAIAAVEVSLSISGDPEDSVFDLNSLVEPIDRCPIFSTDNPRSENSSLEAVELNLNPSFSSDSSWETVSNSNEENLSWEIELNLPHSTFHENTFMDFGVALSSNNVPFSLHTCDVLRRAEESVKVINLMLEMQKEEEDSLKAINIAHCEELQTQCSRMNALPVLENRFDMIDGLNDHLTKILNEASGLKQKLVKATNQDTFDVDYKYHKSIVEFLNSIASTVTNIEKHVEVINWYKKNKVETSTLDSHADVLEEKILTLQEELAHLIQFRTLFKSLEEKSEKAWL